MISTFRAARTDRPITASWEITELGVFRLNSVRVS